jgi:hypothetical protein
MKVENCIAETSAEEIADGLKNRRTLAKQWSP